MFPQSLDAVVSGCAERVAALSARLVRGSPWPLVLVDRPEQDRTNLSEAVWTDGGALGPGYSFGPSQSHARASDGSWPRTLQAHGRARPPARSWPELRPVPSVSSLHWRVDAASSPTPKNVQQRYTAQNTRRSQPIRRDYTPSAGGRSGRKPCTAGFLIALHPVQSSCSERELWHMHLFRLVRPTSGGPIRGTGSNPGRGTGAPPVPNLQQIEETGRGARHCLTLIPPGLIGGLCFYSAGLWLRRLSAVAALPAFSVTISISSDSPA
jgi:hypothetical protein